jgi:membrane protease YdiL (CAAX protease family)
MKATIRAVVVLVVALALCGAVVAYGPGIAEALIAKIGGAAAQDPRFQESVFTIVLFGALIVLALAGGAASGVNAVAPGRKPLSIFGTAFVIGLFGVTATTVYAGIAGTLSQNPTSALSPLNLLWGAGVVLFQSAGEEIYFRGWLQPALARAWGTGAGVVVAALAFAALHIMGGARSPVTLVNLFLGGLLFGILAAYGRGVAGAIAAHFAWNGAEQLVLGLDPNPGIGSFGALINFEMSGAQAWGGSEEGLNASIAMTVALFALLVPLVILTRRRMMAATPA